jgi:hypothetical protein
MRKEEQTALLFVIEPFNNLETNKTIPQAQSKYTRMLHEITFSTCRAARHKKLR